MIRGATGLGPGPRSSLPAVLSAVASAEVEALAEVGSVGGIEQPANLFHGLGGQRPERRPGIAAVEAGHVERDLQTGNTVHRGDRAAQWRDAVLDRARVGVPARLDVRE